MLDGDKQGAHLKVFAGRAAGYVINTSLAETRYNKCAYTLLRNQRAVLYCTCCICAGRRFNFM